jgi:predicted porin
MAHLSERLRLSLLAGVAFSTMASVTPTRAQDASTQQEVRQLRQMLQQQAAAMQVLQRRLAALETKAARAPAPVNQQVAQDYSGSQDGRNLGTVNVTPQLENGSPSIGRPTESRGGTVTPPARPVRPGSENQPTPAGTVNASPQQQAEKQPSPTVTPGSQPLPVLSGNDRVQVTLSGQVNRMVLLHGDGSGHVDTYFADNNVSSTRIRALGSARLDQGVAAISALEFDLRSNSSASVTRQSVNNNGGDSPTLGPFRVRRAEVGMQSEQFGSVLLGRGSTFTDGIAEFDLSGTDIAFYSYLPDSGGSLQFANRSKPFRRSTDPAITQVYDDFDGPRDDRIRYDTPVWRGFSAGGSVAQGGYFDFGSRYAADINGVKIAAGVGFMNYSGTLPSQAPATFISQDGSQAATTPFSRRVAGSAALLFPNGISLLASAGWGEHYGTCCGAGFIAHDDATTYFLKAGYQVSLFPFGKTAFAIQGGQTRNRVQDGDIASRVGLSFDQPVIAKGFEIFGGYEHLMLHRAGQRYAPSDLALLGSRIQF